MVCAVHSKITPNFGVYRAAMLIVEDIVDLSLDRRTRFKACRFGGMQCKLSENSDAWMIRCMHECAARNPVVPTGARKLFELIRTQQLKKYFLGCIEVMKITEAIKYQ
ncbi:hypothetical protein CFB41_03585 [Burkholderia sp. AU33803]|nr:hypothetical protein CFB41_03585 [Burkholderia sp. AU33803]